MGGLARYILGDASVEIVGEEEISDALQKVQSIDDVDNLFIQQGEREKIVHKLLHYDVKDTSAKPQLVPGSKRIAEQMHERTGKTWTVRGQNSAYG